MFDADIFGDATTEEIKALGYDPADSWGRPSPWEFSTQLTAYRQKTAAAQQEEPAEEGPVIPSDEQLAEILAEVYGPEAEQTEEVSEAIGRNGLTLINDPDWVDMTDRNMDYMRHVYRSGLNHADKSVLGVVALHCGANSRGCTASNETLAEEANIDRDNFRKRLSRLTKEGWIRENGMMPSARHRMSGAKIRHIGVKRAWIEGGS
ncbi:helix-turn-helix domain-containing protein [Streptomyces sp. NPDC059861]|uniref:helix-turn-helix domain-containing protein n=1 Tax=Streptomyces sp. NPDC059861 TaxID=3346974 RepID=UPI003656D271